MNGRPMRDDSAREEVGELPQEMSPHLEGHKWSLFFRLARKRADYFSDIEDLLLKPEVDVFPTQRVSAFRRAIETILPQPEGLLALAEQPTRLNAIMEAPTLLLPTIGALALQLEPTPVTAVLATITDEDSAVSSERRWPRRFWKSALAVGSCLRSARAFWAEACRVRGARVDQLSSSSRLTDE
jgi:hypothetical protein